MTTTVSMSPGQTALAASVTHEVPIGWTVGADCPYPSSTIHELIWARALRRPAEIAVRQWDRELTYGALVAGARIVADGLRAHGVAAESHVVVCVDRRPCLVTALLGVLTAGGAYVPVDPHHPALRRDLIIADAHATVAVVDAAGRAALADTPGLIFVDVPDGGGAAPMLARDRRDVVANPDNAAYVLYTSGSTGRPKGVVVSHRSVVAFATATAATCDVNETTRGIAFAALGFDVSVLDLFTVLLAGGTVCLATEADRADPARLQGFLAAHAVTWGYLAPALLPSLDPDELPDLNCLIVGGEAAGPEQVARWCRSGRAFLNWYGPTEATVSVTGSRITGTWTRPLPIGRPLANHRCYVLDDELRPVPPGSRGELCVAGVGLARGYLDAPGLTAERFVPDPFAIAPGARMYRTGDQVAWEPDGRIAFFGRLDGQIKVYGQRVEVGEIEAVLRSHPAVVHAAVDVRPTTAGDVGLVAYLTPGSGPGQNELRAYLAARLPAAMIPGRFVRMDALPLTASSKIDFVALRVSSDPGASPARAATDWPTLTHRAVAQAWAAMFGIDAPAPSDEFIGCGGTSLLAMRLAGMLRETLQRPVWVADVFGARTLGGLADLLASDWGGSQGAPDRGPEPLAGPRPGTGAPALSAAQRRLWFIDRLTGHTPAYNIAVATRLRGPLDARALGDAVGDVVARHAVLRWRIPDKDGVPYVVVTPPLGVTLPATDTSDDDVTAALRREAEQPFDLADGPLWRCRLLRLGADDHVLALTVHHIVFDGWSLAVLNRELSRAYARRIGGMPGEQLAEPVGFADYVAWRAASDGAGWAGSDAGRDWWLTSLAGVPPVLDLPADRTRPPVATFHGAAAKSRIEPAVADSIRQFSRTHGVTGYAVLLAAFGVLLRRLTGMPDLIVGAPIADRRHPALDDVIGFLVDTLPIRLRINDDADFVAHATACHSSVLAAIEHRGIPYDRLVEALRVPRDLSRNPLVQVLFNMYGLTGVEAELAGVEATYLPPGLPGSLFDLTLYVIERDGELTLQAVYNPDLYSAARIDAMLASYQALVGAFLAAPTLPVGCASARPRRAGRVGSGLPELAVPLLPGAVVETLAAMIGDIAAADPDRVAIVGPAGALRYREVLAIADGIRDRIHTTGIAPGETIAVLATRVVELPAVLLGVLDSGTRWLILDPASPVSRLARLAAAADVRLVMRCPGADLPPEIDLPVVDVSEIVGSAPAGSATAAPTHHRGYYMATSGTTGEPLLIDVDEAPLARFLRWYADRFGLCPDDATALLGGLAHDPLLREAFAPLIVGGRVCVPDPAWRQDPAALAEFLVAERVTILHLTPSLGRMLAGAAVALPAVRLVVFGGDRLTGADIAAIQAIAPGATVVNGYGTTETPQLQSMHVIDVDTAVAGPMSIGHGIAGAELHVINPQGSGAAIGELGEVVIRGRNLAIGYTNAGPAMGRFTANPYTDDGGDRMFATGDLGRYDAEGRVVLAGRRDDQVKIRGHRVELGDVEAALAAHPDVAAAAVHCVGLDAALVAYAVPRRAGVATSALRDYLASRLPDYACPTDVVLLATMPLTPNGKVDRAALPSPAAATRAAPGHTEPATATERLVAAAWREVLGLPRVSVTANFFNSGGHSLAIVAVQARLRILLDRQVDIVDLFRFPNVRALASHLDGGRRSAGLDRADRRLAARARQLRHQPGPRPGTTHEETNR